MMHVERVGAGAILMLALCAGAQGQTAVDSVAPPPDLKPGWWLLPKTDIRMTVGGYLKFDLIHDLKPIGSPNFFDVSKIPTDGSTGTSTQLQAIETRVWMDFRRDSKFGEVRAYVEGDFYGSGQAFRMRHAYVQIGERWLAGQTWSTFMDESIIPSTLDYEKPAAYAFARHAMLRYSQPLGENMKISLALEEPSLNIRTPEPGALESPLPDVTMRARYTRTWGHVQLSGFGATSRFVPDSGAVQNVESYGVNLSGQINFLKKDKFIYQAIYGPGMARYRFGTFAGPDDNGKIQAVIASGFTAGVLHHWSDQWSTFLMYNIGFDERISEGQPGTDPKGLQYGAVNLLWHFTPYAFAGVEYLHGVREDLSTKEGTADRIMLSLRVNLN